MREDANKWSILRDDFHKYKINTREDYKREEVRWTSIDNVFVIVKGVLVVL